MGDLRQQRLELLPAPGVAADRQRAQRVAVIALASGDEPAALRLADLDEILPGELERGLDRLGAAGDEVDPVDALGRHLDQAIGQPLGRRAREEAGVGVGQLVGLRLDRRDHPRMAMAEAGNRSAAAGVQIAPAVLVDERDALAADRDRVGLLRLAMEDVAHDVPPD